MRFYAILTISLFALLVTACGESEKTPKTEEKIDNESQLSAGGGTTEKEFRARRRARRRADEGGEKCTASMAIVEGKCEACPEGCTACKYESPNLNCTKCDADRGLPKDGKCIAAE